MGDDRESEGGGDPARVEARVFAVVDTARGHKAQGHRAQICSSTMSFTTTGTKTGKKDLLFMKPFYQLCRYLKCRVSDDVHNLMLPSSIKVSHA